MHVFYEDLTSGKRGLLADMHFLKRDPQHVRDRMQLLARKIREKLPVHVVPGIAPRGDHVDLALGVGDGMMPGMHLAVLGGDAFSEPLRLNGELVEAVVER